MDDNDYPVPAKFRSTMPEDLRAVHEANDKEGWTYAMEWLADIPLYFKRGGDPARIGSSLVLTGPPGTGKTMLASACLNYIGALRHPKTTAFIDDGSLDSFLRRARYSRLDEDDEYLLSRLQGVGCVVVDDALRLGGTAEILEPFLRKRYMAGKPTILTINSGITLADAMKSFLSEWTWARFTGADQRQV